MVAVIGDHSEKYLSLYSHILFMADLMQICESTEVEKREKTRNRIYRTFAEIFLEEPVPQGQLPGESKIYATIPIPEPTFCYFRGIPLIDDADWFEA